MMTNMSDDWADDEGLTADEVRARFEALPPALMNDRLPAGGIVVRPSLSYGAPVTLLPEPFLAGSKLRVLQSSA